MTRSPDSRRGAPPPTLATRARRAVTGLLIGGVVAWLAWPLVGLLSTWLMLPSDFAPMATALLAIMVVMGGVAGWAYDPGEEEPGEE